LPGQQILSTGFLGVLWVTESKTEVGLFWDGELLQKRFCLSDFYGFLWDGKAPDASKLATELNLTSDDRLEVRAVTEIYETGCRLIPGNPDWIPEYETIDLMYGTPEDFQRVQEFDWNLPRTEEEWNPRKMPTTSRREVGSWLVWTSKRTAEENFQTIAELCASFGVEFPQEAG